MKTPALERMQKALALAAALGIPGCPTVPQPLPAQEPAVPVYPEAVPDARNQRAQEVPALYYTAEPLADVVAFYRRHGAAVEVAEEGDRAILWLEADSRTGGARGADAGLPGPDRVRVVAETGANVTDGAIRRAHARARAALERQLEEREGANAIAKRGELADLEEQYQELSELYFPHVKDGEGEIRSSAAILFGEYHERIMALSLTDPGPLREEARRLAEDEEVDRVLVRILEAAAEEDAFGRGRIWADYLDRVEKEGFITRLRIPREPAR